MLGVAWWVWFASGFVLWEGLSEESFLLSTLWVLLCV